MENRFCRLFLVGLLLSNIAALQAAELQELGADAEVERREIHEALIDSENFEIGISGGLLSIEDFGSNTTLVARVAYHITEDFFAEGAYGQSEAGLTSSEQRFSSAPLMTDDERQFIYYNLSLGLNILPGEAFITSGKTFNNSLYVIAGVGVTEFAGEELFTINYGVGYRLLVNDWLALRFDSRDHVFNSDVVGQKKDTHNMEMLFGMTLFF